MIVIIAVVIFNDYGAFAEAFAEILEKTATQRENCGNCVITLRRKKR